MNLRPLKFLIDRKAHREKLWNLGGEWQSLPSNLRELTTEQAEMIFQHIDGDLSPENITCDGEASAEQVRRETALLRGSIQSLNDLGHFPIKQVWSF
jgi:hypothetical protein